LLYGGDVKGKKAIVQGFGNVGSAFYLEKNGMNEWGLINEEVYL
jgi:glutamate dehydrogenase/leucine dehydrogenase